MIRPEQGWLAPRCESRTGAAHQRRGAPCQDASGLWCFRSGEGEAVQVLVVSDGHGGSRYDRSEVGSRLACLVALEEIQSELAALRLSPGPTPQDWRHWLAESLPARLLERWRREVLRHAIAHPRRDGRPPSTLPYGATLGVLLLTSRWWGYTGLGDWDLVRIRDDGHGELLSEEPELAGGGEATYSLCMEEAERHFACRSDLVSLQAAQEPFQLLLSSDGIRKSCGSDADFLTLARHLCALPPPEADTATSAPAGPALAEALDHISRQGSGDDVSVAIAGWGPLEAAPQGQGRQPRPWQQRSGPLIVQPVPEPQEQVARHHLEWERQTLARLPKGAPQPRSLVVNAPQLRSWRCLAAWMVGGMGAWALGLALAGAVLLAWGPFARRPSESQEPSPELAVVLRRESLALCGERRGSGPGAGAAANSAREGEGSPPVAGDQRWGAAAGDGKGDGIGDAVGDGTGGADRTAGGDSGEAAPETPAAADPSDRGALSDHGRKANGPAAPALNPARLGRITATLNQRRSTFRAMTQGTIQPATFLTRPDQDPTGALIAWSFRQREPGPTPPTTSRGRGIRQALASVLPAGWVRAENMAATGPPLAFCPELSEGLRRQWQAAQMESSPARPPSKPQSSVPTPPLTTPSGAAALNGNPPARSKP